MLLEPKKIRIGIDIMGSDNAPDALLDAVQALQLPDRVELTAVGTPDYESSSLHYVCAQEVIHMDDSPLTAVRKKKNSSLCIGLRLLKEKTIDAFISAGNTGALVSASKVILGNLPKILRPALLALMPTKKKPVAVLDVGANIEAKAAHLLQFAAMGAAYQKARGIQNPIIGLLNIGSEKIKGTSELRRAYEELQKGPFHFAGNIEGTSVFNGDVDVLIADGFTGNIFLKTAEGIASLILDRLYTHIPPLELQKLAPHLNDLHRSLHYAEYPGALLSGVRGIVIKCHGYSTPRAFANAIPGAAKLVQENFISSFGI
ncbi:MAG: phosphate acyltransferase PlsX [Verrucomicrobia bacterium]|nr:phosphate acyltransferase PlsX [Verrucomicrobiota bacterium]